jgi:hypothetical protein
MIGARKIANVGASTWLDVSIPEVDVRRVAPTIRASPLVIIKYGVVVALMWVGGEQWHVLEESCGLRELKERQCCRLLSRRAGWESSVRPPDLSVLVEVHTLVHAHP